MDNKTEKKTPDYIVPDEIYKKELRPLKPETVIMATLLREQMLDSDSIDENQQKEIVKNFIGFAEAFNPNEDQLKELKSKTRKELLSINLGSAYNADERLRTDRQNEMIADLEQGADFDVKPSEQEKELRDTDLIMLKYYADILAGSNIKLNNKIKINGRPVDISSGSKAQDASV